MHAAQGLEMDFDDFDDVMPRNVSPGAVLRFDGFRLTICSCLQRRFWRSVSFTRISSTVSVQSGLHCDRAAWVNADFDDDFDDDWESPDQ